MRWRCLARGGPRRRARQLPADGSLKTMPSRKPSTQAAWGRASPLQPANMTACQSMAALLHGPNVVAASRCRRGDRACPRSTETGGEAVALGTPGEEGGGGKNILHREGSLRGDIDAMMLVYPGILNNIAHSRTVGATRAGRLLMARRRMPRPDRDSASMPSTPCWPAVQRHQCGLRQQPRRMYESMASSSPGRHRCLRSCPITRRP